ncbi:MAG: hypothetical protein AAGN46_03650 [Acidobacteriota bacterium]
MAEMQPVFGAPWAEFFIAAVALGLFLAMHLLIWWRRGVDRCGFGAMVGLWALAVVGALAIALWAPGSALGLGTHAEVHAVTVVAFCGAWMALYLHLYTGMLRSVSLRILGELLVCGGRLTLADLEAAYSPTSMLAGRLAWMVERGWLRLGADGSDEAIYHLTDAGRRLLAMRRPLVGRFVAGPTG